MRIMLVFFIVISVVIALDPPAFIAQLMGISWGALAGAFLAPFIYYFILIFAHNEQWNLFDLWILWSFVYWPTYIAGVITIAFSVYKLKK